jgi:predicted alpha/beta superfamily hydrolase
MSEVERMIIGGRECFLCRGQGPVFLIGDSRERPGYCESIVSECVALGLEAPTVMIFEVDDWDRDFSPWPARGMDEEHPLGDGAGNTLAWIEEHAMAYIKEAFPEAPVIAAGYSLAGLFALWAFLSSDIFAGAVCCSGSLWMDGWIDFMSSHKARREGCVYLSLGGKEEKTPHPLLKTIGDCTRTADRLLAADPNVYANKLEMNKGGHFADSAKRLAKGLVWSGAAVRKHEV